MTIEEIMARLTPQERQHVSPENVAAVLRVLSASIADTGPKAHAIDCEYIKDDNPWARCTCGVGGPNDGRKSIADTAGAKPLTDGQVESVMYGIRQKFGVRLTPWIVREVLQALLAAPPAPSVADAAGASENDVARVIFSNLFPRGMCPADWDSGAILGPNNETREQFLQAARAVIAAIAKESGK